MIENISLARVATFGEKVETLSGLSTFNYIYGPNGAGKTTISRVVADATAHPCCAVTWKAGARLDVLVYNRDFVAANFLQQPHLRGIFTLGKEHVEAERQIEEAKAKLAEIQARIRKHELTLGGEDGKGGKKGELAVLEDKFKDECWKHKQKYDRVFAGALGGYRGSTEKFKAKILEEHKRNAGPGEPLEALTKKAATVFGAGPATLSVVPNVDAGGLVAMESDAILSKRIVGKADVDIAAIIVRLGNSDWVKQGREYFEAADGTCPFCQQVAPPSLAKSLEDYFDDAFSHDVAAIDSLSARYGTAAERLRRGLEAAVESRCQFLDEEGFKAQKEVIEARLAVNLQRIAGKKKEPSSVVTLEPLSEPLATAKAMLYAANEQVQAHNKTVANIAQEKVGLTSQVWRHIVHVDLKDAINDYATKKANIESAIRSLGEQISAGLKENSNKLAEIRALEKSVTSIQPTLDAINGLLQSFGFGGFKLAKADDGLSYKVIRLDGTDAKESLSEGERTFITFLYFYHLVKGSDSERGLTTDRVVVIDDPVSSLDSDILFIVSSLIKVLCEDVRSSRGSIRQVFVLTHNVYFHKEVTFSVKRPRNGLFKDETFWTVRKGTEWSTVERHTCNPITTSYDLLWAEVRREDRSSLAIQNTLRRILENYFKILGGIDLDAVCGEFEGRDQWACKSLLSWVNDGSHFAHDDVFVTIDSSTVENYLRVFRLIFEKTGHRAHYDMMMRVAPDGESGTIISNAVPAGASGADAGTPGEGRHL